MRESQTVRGGDTDVFLVLSHQKVNPCSGDICAFDSEGIKENE